MFSTRKSTQPEPSSKHRAGKQSISNSSSKTRRQSILHDRTNSRRANVERVVRKADIGSSSPVSEYDISSSDHTTYSTNTVKAICPLLSSHFALDHNKDFLHATRASCRRRLSSPVFAVASSLSRIRNESTYQMRYQKSSHLCSSFSTRATTTQS